eukprot:TRINITY_DN6159_c0_g1_i1.p1 TRINITY_DN6159_c0_g1~~TRINITY_DN6159_c0_g1_i1.p1  ORF type:complete len:179 (+),score=27.99 TRINITY_DN6159_c0_g1_i1:247-783(+)
MYNALQRLNASFFHGTTIIFLCALATNLTVFWNPGAPPIYELNAHDPVKFIRHDHQKNPIKADVAVLRFDIDVDLRHAWNWNVKEIFVYVTAEYSTPEHPINQVTIWDHTIESEQMAMLSKKGVLSKYNLFDHGFGLRGTKVSFHLNWYIVPVSGPLFSLSRQASSMTLPLNYTHIRG